MSRIIRFIVRGERCCDRDVIERRDGWRSSNCWEIWIYIYTFVRRSMLCRTVPTRIDWTCSQRRSKISGV